MDKLKRDIIIEKKIQNPSSTLKEIALKEGIGYTYARRVWAKYKRELVTNKGVPFTPFPFFVQTMGYFTRGLPWMYSDCPVIPSSNRNLQKVFKTPYFSIVLHRNGTIFVYDYHVDWKKHLSRWLNSWIEDSKNVKQFLSSLDYKDEKHVAFNAPGAPTNFRLNIKGLGTFAMDKTPFKDGTIEYEYDAGFMKKMDQIEKVITKQTETMQVFAKGMEDHMKLIAELQYTAQVMTQALKGIIDIVEKLKNANQPKTHKQENK